MGIEPEIDNAQTSSVGWFLILYRSNEVAVRVLKISLRKMRVTTMRKEEDLSVKKESQRRDNEKGDTQLRLPLPFFSLFFQHTSFHFVWPEQ